MKPLNSKTIHTPSGEKTVEVRVMDIRDLREHLDVMTFSCFYHGYHPTRGTLLGAFYEKNISVEQSAKNPYIDLRESSNIWLSRQLKDQKLPIDRIGCIEMSSYREEENNWRKKEGEILHSIQSYFRMLDIASLAGVKIETIGFPILGGGNQNVPQELVTIPVLNEISRFLKENEYVKRIIVLTHNQEQAFQFAMSMERSYMFVEETCRRQTAVTADTPKGRAFISYSSQDRNIADNLCTKLENAKIPVWYAPRNIDSNDYASAIVSAITEAAYFIVILSENSLKSQHVLNEVDLAFKELNRGIRFLPLKIDKEEMGPSFLYYLSRQHWLDAQLPPLEERLDEFVEKLLHG